MDDAVKADPMAELNQSAIARLFMDQWLRQFEADRRNFKSVAVREWREDRNDVLADDIDRVYSMFRRFLSECTCALSRMLLHEWYSVAVVQKKNNRKYIAYYSNWFNSAPRAMLRKVYVAWKREAADELTKQRDSAQADNLAMRNDRKQAEDWTRQLELRIKAATLNVFRNVQEAPPGSDEQLELIYSEFCEALVAMATFYFPDPFIKTATKLTQFLRRYLPLSPEDT
ncbi:hypothetical protein JG687_00007073 [Phytophthora cactorum]|uniref:Uncharacterized protein n=1 Tax=Phytophthora cactorum TaxID=29920 RepID=A0A8T1ULC7_9STRA|nr:hypothetical protein JG687_00007073 [Phytophthora cactorum]